MLGETRLFGELFSEPPRNGLTRPKAVRGVGMKMVNMGELFANPRLRNAAMDRVPVSDSEAHRFILRDGDLLFARQSLVLEGAGKCSIFLGDDQPVTFESHVTRVRLDPRKADPNYYYYYLQSHHGRAAIRSIVEQGAGASGIRGSDLETLEVSWRPLPEQRAIGHILATLDDKIESNRRMSDALEVMARALFRSWFVDFDPVRAKAEGRDPGFPTPLADLFPGRLVDSEIGEIPEGWVLGTLEDLSILNPEAWSKATRPAEIRYVDLSNVKWGRIDAITAYQASDAPSRAQRVLRPGDTIVGTVRPGNGSYAFISEDGLTASTGFAVLRPRRPQYAQFVYLAATAADKIDTLAHLADGAAYPAVRPEVVAATRLVHPDDELLRRFSQTGNLLLQRMAQNAEHSQTLAAVRDALLPRLISGELRIGNAEKFIGRAT